MAAPMAVPCAPKYVRAAPGYCMAAVFAVESWGVTTGACDSHRLTTVPSAATLLSLKILHDVFSTNMVNTKVITTGVWNGPQCTGSFQLWSTHIREFVPVPANTRLFQRSFVVPVPIVSGKVVSDQSFVRVGSASQVRFEVVGYYD